MSNQYKNELAVTFTGKVDASFKKAVNDVSSSLKGIAGSGRGGGAIQSVDKQSKSAAKSMGIFSGATNSVVSAFKTLARFAVAGAIFGGITSAVTKSITAVVEYDQALKNLQAITNATNFEVEAFGAKMFEVSNITKFSAAEVAQAMVYIGQAGFSAAESLKTIDAIASVATGTLTDFATTADLFTSTLRAFQLEAGESGRVADIFASAVNRSKLTVQGLRTIFNYVGASANQAGVELQEAAAAAGLLANNGMRFSTIGTSMRNVISRMIAPNAKLRRSLVEVGLSVDDVNPKVVGFRTAMQNLGKVLTDQRTGLADAGKAYELFGLRGQQAANVFVRSFTGPEYDKLLKNITSTGMAFRQQIIQQQGLGVKVKNLADRLGNLGINFAKASGLAWAFEEALDATSNTVLKLNRHLEKMDEGGLKEVLRLLSYINPASVAQNAIMDNLVTKNTEITKSLKEQTSAILKQYNEEKRREEGLKRYVAALKSLQEEEMNVWHREEQTSNIVKQLIVEYSEYADVIEKAGVNLEELIRITESASKEGGRSGAALLAKSLIDVQKKLDVVHKKMSEQQGGALRGVLEREREELLSMQKELSAAMASDINIPDMFVINEQSRKNYDQMVELYRTKWQATLDEMGGDWASFANKIVASGDVGKISKLLEAITTAQADARGELDKIVEHGIPVPGGSAEAFYKKMYASSLGALKKEFHDEEARELEIARREAERQFKRTTDAYKAELDTQLAAVKKNEAEKIKQLVISDATKLTQIKAEKEFLDAAFTENIKHYNKLIAVAEKTAIARGDIENEVLKKYLEEKSALIIENETKNIELERKIFEERMANPENFADAWESAMRSIEKSTRSSFSKVRDWIVNSVDEFADSSADAFLDFVEGTKNAGKAFSEMAYSILRDLTKMIIKQQIMNAVMAGMDAASSSGGFLGSIGSFFTSAMSTNHSGGMAGKASSIKKQMDPSAFINAPRFHNGGEVPAVLEKGEVVQTREQAAQSREPRNVQVVIENKTGTQVGNAIATSSINMGEEIIRIVLDGIDRNRSGLRTKVASVR